MNNLYHLFMKMYIDNGIFKEKEICILLQIKGQSVPKFTLHSRRIQCTWRTFKLAKCQLRSLINAEK